MRPADGGDPVDPDQVSAVGGDDRLPVAAGAGTHQRSRPQGAVTGTPGPDRRLLLGGAVALVATLAVGIGVGLSVARSPVPDAVAAPVPTVTMTEEPAPSPSPPPVVVDGPVPEPARVEIPSLGVDAPLIDLFVAEDGTMGVPTTAEQIGWWEDGPIPGEPGASLIAAHVSLGGEDGAFVDLGTMTAGDEVVVDRVDGSVATYTVTSVEQFPKNEFPEERVYSYDGPTRLHLVTCGGAINSSTGHYKDNIVVFADLVSDTRAPTDA